jgi:hypothetical protein
MMGGCTGCEPNVPYVNTLLDFLKILTALKTSIDKFYDPTEVVASVVGKFAVKGKIGAPLYTRVQWVKMYKSVYEKFDVNSVVHINLLKDIYLSIGMDWTTDEWLVNWTNNYYSTEGGSPAP